MKSNGRGGAIDGIFTITQKRVYFALKRTGRIRAFSGIADLVVSGLAVSGAVRSVRLPLSGLSGLTGAAEQDDFVQGWIVRSAFGDAALNWQDLRGHVENDIQHLEMQMETFIEDPETAQTGHVAGLDGAGHLVGWTTKPESNTHELPVLARVGGARLCAFSAGRWASENFRRFALPLDAVVQGTDVHRLQLSGGCTRAEPFGRAQSFIMRTPAGLVQAAPVQLAHDTVQGAFQMAGDPDTAVTVTLRDGAYQSDTFRCDQSVLYNFNGKPCGFTLPLSPSTPINPATCKIVLGRAQGDDLGSFALSDFMTAPDCL